MSLISVIGVFVLCWYIASHLAIGCAVPPDRVDTIIWLLHHLNTTISVHCTNTELTNMQIVLDGIQRILNNKTRD